MNKQEKRERRLARQAQNKIQKRKARYKSMIYNLCFNEMKSWLHSHKNFEIFDTQYIKINEIKLTMDERTNLCNHWNKVKEVQNRELARIKFVEESTDTNKDLLDLLTDRDKIIKLASYINNHEEPTFRAIQVNFKKDLDPNYTMKKTVLINNVDPMDPWQLETPRNEEARHSLFPKRK